jgi:hypothetical protein
MTAIVTAKVSVIVLDGEIRIPKDGLIMCREEKYTQSKHKDYAWSLYKKHSLLSYDTIS